MLLISKNDTAGVAERIDELEARYRIELPEDYKRFLLKYNGGETPCTTMRSGRSTTRIQHFFAVTDAAAYGICYYEANRYLEDRYLEKGVFPIADDSFGNTISIDITDEGKGTVYFMDHERGNRRTKVADTFVKFLNKCTSEVLVMPTIEERTEAFRKRGKEVDDGWIRTWQEEIDRYAGFQQEEVIL
jgi:cell wall assembly regulator SMI1